MAVNGRPAGRWECSVCKYPPGAHTATGRATHLTKSVRLFPRCESPNFVLRFD